MYEIHARKDDGPLFKRLRYNELTLGDKMAAIEEINAINLNFRIVVAGYQCYLSQNHQHNDLKRKKSAFFFAERLSKCKKRLVMWKFFNQLRARNLTGTIIHFKSID